MNPLAAPLIRRAADGWGLKPEDVLGVARHQSTADARAFAVWLVRRELACSYPELGRIFGRDHSTCQAAVRKVERAIVTGKPPRLAWIAGLVLRAEKPCGQS